MNAIVDHTVVSTAHNPPGQDRAVHSDERNMPHPPRNTPTTQTGNPHRAHDLPHDCSPSMTRVRRTSPCKHHRPHRDTTTRTPPSVHASQGVPKPRRWRRGRAGRAGRRGRSGVIKDRAHGSHHLAGICVVHEIKPGVRLRTTAAKQHDSSQTVPRLESSRGPSSRR